jgi:hypothetical protein
MEAIARKHEVSIDSGGGETSLNCTSHSNDDILFGWIKQPVRFRILTITKKYAFMRFGLQLLFFSSRICAQHSLPNTLKLLMFGHLPLHFSSGVTCKIALVGTLFKIWLAQQTTSTQNILYNPFEYSIHLAISTKVLFFLSTTPFYWGV